MAGEITMNDIRVEEPLNTRRIPNLEQDVDLIANLRLGKIGKLTLATIASSAAVSVILSGGYGLGKLVAEILYK